MSKKRQMRPTIEGESIAKMRRLLSELRGMVVEGNTQPIYVTVDTLTNGEIIGNFCLRYTISQTKQRYRKNHNLSV